MDRQNDILGWNERFKFRQGIKCFPPIIDLLVIDWNLIFFWPSRSVRSRENDDIVRAWRTASEQRLPGVRARRWQRSSRPQQEPRVHAGGQRGEHPSRGRSCQAFRWLWRHSSLFLRFSLCKSEPFFAVRRLSSAWVFLVDLNFLPVIFFLVSRSLSFHFTACSFSNLRWAFSPCVVLVSDRNSSNLPFWPWKGGMEEVFLLNDFGQEVAVQNADSLLPSARKSISTSVVPSFENSWRLTSKSTVLLWYQWKDKKSCVFSKSCNEFRLARRHEKLPLFKYFMKELVCELETMQVFWTLAFKIR